MRFIGVELDRLSGRIARVLYPGHDIRIENFRDTRLPEGRIDAVIGNVPFADLRLDYGGMRLALHDFFLAKSLDALKPGGILALVTSHYTLDKQDPALREHLAQQADFLGAIRLPSEAFQQEGTRVVTDILCLRKRAPGEAPAHSDPAWLETAPLTIEGVDIPINRYFLQHPAMVLGTWSRQDRLYASAADYSLRAQGDLAAQLTAADPAAARRRVHGAPQRASTPGPCPSPAAAPDPTSPKAVSLLRRRKALMQIQQGEAVPVTHGTTPLQADGTLMGRRLAALIALRDQARRVLQSQNEGWPEAHRHEARRALTRVYDRFVATYGPINKTTLSTTTDGTTIRRMPNLVTFRDDPDAMLVMALEHYDERTGLAEKAAIMHHDVVGRHTPVRPCRAPRKGCWSPSTSAAWLICPTSPRSMTPPCARSSPSWATSSIRTPTPRPGTRPMSISLGNVRAKLAAAERAGAAYARNAEALRLVQPEDVLPGDIDANLGAPWIPETDIQAFAADLFRVAVGHGVHRPPANRCGLERRDGPGGGAVGGRHHGLRHGPCQRRRAAGAGPQPEKPDHL